MDVFFLKPNQRPLSPSFTCCISPTISFRPHFFGSEFRRPSRRRKWLGLGLGLGLGFQFHSPSLTVNKRRRRRFVFRTSAALDPQTVVVIVSFVAVSALAVFYFNYSNKKHHDRSNKISKRLDHTNSQQVSSILNHTYNEENSSNVGQNSNGASKFMVKEVNNISHDEPAPVQYNEKVLFYEEALKTVTTVSSGCDTIASSIIEHSASPSFEKKDYVMMESQPPNVTVLSSLESHSVLLGSGDVLCIPPTERNVVCFDEKHKTEHDSELPKLMVETELIAASVPINSKVAGGNVIVEKNYALTKERDVSRYSFAAIKSTHNGLHSFYEANKYAMSSMENLSSTARPGISSSGNKCFSSLASSSISQSERFSAKDFLHAAEKFEAKLPHGKSETGPLNGRGDFWKKRMSSSDKEKTMLTKDDLKHLFPTSQLKKQGSSQDYASQQLRAYHRFLKEGRVTDCLEKLEYLERKGLLDMNNVYHMGFLRVCRSQRAVKEAFRFINLIPNPTLSTFNMLMSICACSQDLEGGFEVLQLVKKAGLKADCKLYTTLISTCAKSIKVDTMFKVFHEMVNLGVEPNVHTYGALIDGCAKAGQVAKAFGAYGIMRSK